MSTQAALPEQPSSLAPAGAEFPKRFGKYVLLGPLGQGGMGAIYLARDEAQNLCVIKRIKPGFDAVDGSALRRFMDEARIARVLQHANICQVFDVGEVGRDAYMAMAYAGRTTLRDLHLRAREIRHPVDVATATFMVTEVLAGLHYAHEKKNDAGENLGIVHRDISPQNVMVTAAGAIKLIDFGLAYSTEKREVTETGATLGKIQYMAPEQVCSRPVDARVDQFAAGMLLYELVVGERFYEGLATHEIWLVASGGHRPRKWALFEQRYPTLAELVEIALAAEPAGRFSSCAAFRNALLKFLDRFSEQDLEKAAPGAGAPSVARLLKALWPAMADDESAFLLALPTVSHRAQRALPKAAAPVAVDRGEALPSPVVTRMRERTAEVTTTANVLPPRRRRSYGLPAAAAILLLVVGGGILWASLPVVSDVVAVERTNAMDDVSDEVGSDGQLPPLPSERGVLTSERGVLTSERGVLTSERGISTSERGVSTSERGVSASERAVLTSGKVVKAVKAPGKSTKDSRMATRTPRKLSKGSGRPARASGKATAIKPIQKTKAKETAAIGMEKSKMKAKRARWLKRLERCDAPCASRWKKRLLAKDEVSAAFLSAAEPCLKSCR